MSKGNSSETTVQVEGLERYVHNHGDRFIVAAKWSTGRGGLQLRPLRDPQTIGTLESLADKFGYADKPSAMRAAQRYAGNIAVIQQMKTDAKAASEAKAKEPKQPKAPAVAPEGWVSLEDAVKQLGLSSGFRVHALKRWARGGDEYDLEKGGKKHPVLSKPWLEARKFDGFRGVLISQASIDEYAVHRETKIKEAQAAKITAAKKKAEREAAKKEAAEKEAAKAASKEAKAAAKKTTTKSKATKEEA
jgi:hypothetical protein